jgi:hypothetical protein
MLFVPFVDNGELANDFINEELFAEGGELGGESMLGLPKICGYVGSGAWGIKCLFLLLEIQISYTRRKLVHYKRPLRLGIATHARKMHNKISI